MGNKKQIMYSLEVETAAIKGEGKPHRHPLVVKGDLVTKYNDAVSTCYEAFRHSCETVGDSPCLGTRNGDSYEWLTYKQVQERVINFGNGLAVKGIKAEDSPVHVAIYSVNRTEWIVTEQACFTKSFVTVPLYDTLGDASIKHICNQTEAAVCVATCDRALNLVKLAKDIDSLKMIVVMDSISDALKDAVKAFEGRIERNIY